LSLQTFARSRKNGLTFSKKQNKNLPLPPRIGKSPYCGKLSIKTK
jgi:hypothetical protein